MILGIDLGTSMVKAALFNRDGTCLGVASRRSSPTSYGRGRIEQDFEDIVRYVGEVVREVCAMTGHVPEAVGITGQSDGLWLLDDRGKAVCNAISWLDDRGNPYLQNWIDSGIFAAVFRRNANAIFPGSQAPLMAAMAQSNPEILAKATTASYLKDAILQRLTGVRITDASDASLPFLNIKTRTYDDEILRLLGLTRYKHLLAPIQPAPGQVFPINEAGAALTGLAKGLPIHAGPFDLPACAMGAGIRHVGDGLIILGTTLACQMMVDEVVTDTEPVGMTLCMPREGYWMRAMCAMVGTAALDWVLTLLNLSHDRLDALLTQSRRGANGVKALPFFSVTGERAPFVDVRARGQIANLSIMTTPADIVMAICESVAYAARHCVEAVGLSGNICVSGGGANSRLWCQLVADVLQHPLSIAPRSEIGARGASIAVMDVLGLDYDPSLWTKSEGIIEPNQDVAQHYAQGFAHYLDTLSAAQKLWPPIIT